jgi:hypothetical protein
MLKFLAQSKMSLLWRKINLHLNFEGGTNVENNNHAKIKSMS